MSKKYNPTRPLMVEFVKKWSKVIGPTKKEIKKALTTMPPDKAVRTVFKKNRLQSHLKELILNTVETAMQKGLKGEK